MSRKKSRKAAALARRRDQAGDSAVAPAKASQSASARPDVRGALQKAGSPKMGSMPRRTILKSAAIVGGAVTIGVGIHLFDTKDKLRHDLSIIGSGKPVVVQVHDPSCPSCRQLMRSTESALKTLPQIEYRVADLTSKAGRTMAAEYKAEKVTLLLFDARGDHLGTIKGVHSKESLQSAFMDQFSIQQVVPADA